MNNKEIFAKLTDQDNHNLSIVERLSKLEEKLERIEKKRSWWDRLISGIIGGVIVLVIGGVIVRLLH